MFDNSFPSLHVFFLVFVGFVFVCVCVCVCVLVVVGVVVFCVSFLK